MLGILLWSNSHYVTYRIPHVKTNMRVPSPRIALQLHIRIHILYNAHFNVGTFLDASANEQYS